MEVDPMTQFEKQYYEKRGQQLVKNLNTRFFEAYYCDNKEEAKKKQEQKAKEKAAKKAAKEKK